MSGAHIELAEGLIDDLKAKGVAATLGPSTPFDAIAEARRACIERARHAGPADGAL